MEIENRIEKKIILRQLRMIWGSQVPNNILYFFIKVYNESIRKGKIFVNEIKNIKLEFMRVMEDRVKMHELIEDYLIPHDIEKRINAEISTPFALRTEMIESMDQKRLGFNFWSGQYVRNDDLSWNFVLPKIFEPCCGKGGFLMSLIDKLMIELESEIQDEKERYRKIVEECLYFADINPLNIFICKVLLGKGDINKYKFNVYTGDTLNTVTNIILNFFKVNRFDLIIGNPPYSTDPSQPDTKTLYNLFIEKYIDTTDYLLFVVPSKWFSAGKGLDKFRHFMLSRKDILFIKHVQESKKWFSNVVIKGGVNYFLKVPYETECDFNNQKIILNKYDILLEPDYRALIDKICHHPSIDTIHMSRSYYSIETNDKRLHDVKQIDDIDCYVSVKKSIDRKKFINKKYCSKNPTWKVITPEANGKEKSGFGYMTIIEPENVYSNSYIGFEVKNKEAGENLISYLKCKLPNTLLNTRKITQHINAFTLKWIPLVPLNKKWNDKEVYEYFGLMEQEIKLIER